MSLSDLPDDILGLISFWLNGFDNCCLWMASDSTLRQRLVNNVITDFHIKYTIPGRYLWPGNFLKKLSKLSRLSLVVHEDVYHLPIQNIELFSVPTLKYLKLDSTNAIQLFEPIQMIESSNHPTGPATASINEETHLNNLLNSLEYLEIISSWSQHKLSIDFIRCLPQNLKILSIPKNHFYLDPETDFTVFDFTSMLPPQLTSVHILFDDPYIYKAYLDFSKLPGNLTNLTTNLCIHEESYPIIRSKGLKALTLLRHSYDILKLSPFLPTGLESLSSGNIIMDENLPTTQCFSHLGNLKFLSLGAPGSIDLPYLITNCPPKLEDFSCVNLTSANLPLSNRLFGDHLTRLSLINVVEITPQFISSLPQSLTDLTLYQYFDSPNKSIVFLSHLPRNLKSLFVNFEIAENTSLLPESMTYLRLDDANPSDSSCFDRLPSKLETLILSQKLPRLTMMQLPTSLTHLFLETTEHLDDEIVRMLPRGLKELSLYLPDNLSDAAMADLPPLIEKLLLRKNTSLTDNAIRLLPRSVVELNLPRNRNLTDECIKHLPRRLTGLYLNSATKITSNSCIDLPKYLKVLMLPKCKNWDPEKLIASKHELPQYIKTVHLGNRKANKRWPKN